MATLSSTLAWRIPMDRGAWQAAVHGVTKDWTRWVIKHSTAVPCSQGFPGSSAGIESTCSAGDPGSIPGPGSSPGEGIGYPLQDSFAFLVAQMVKNLPAMCKTWVRSLGWEHPLEKGMATNSSIVAWRIPMDSRAWQATIHGVAKNQTQLSDEAHTCILFIFKCSQIQKIISLQLSLN